MRLRRLEDIFLANLPDKENKAKYVQETFNSIANNYDLMNKLMTFGMDKSWRRLAVKRSELKEGGTGLDICCGTGMLTMEQARTAGSAGRITGLDFSENMIAVARQNIMGFEFKDSIQFIQGDAMNLPFEDNVFDCATVGWGLRNVPDILKTVQEMMRVVKPGGKVISLDMA
jgi:demethylmenaquinone methyltransferase/2-methoxy-6-polyprenyl-1,4-benzoquinol methylase